MTANVQAMPLADQVAVHGRFSGHMGDDGVAAFTAERFRLIRIATRILGDTAGAEDVVQEVWIRWQRTHRAEIHCPAAFLATATTRVAINVLQSAHHRRETSVTPWMDDMSDVARATLDPSANLELNEDAKHAIKVLMERLTATERAVYLLRKAFDYPYSRIATVLPVSAANARQLVRRAGLKLLTARTQPVDELMQRRLIRAFVVASNNGELSDLEVLLVADMRRAPNDDTVHHRVHYTGTPAVEARGGATRST